MIVTKLDEINPQKPRLVADIDNGDLQAINLLMEKYNFKDHESLVRFAFGALLESEDKTIYVKKDGEMRSLRPAKKLLNSTDTEDDEEE